MGRSGDRCLSGSARGGGPRNCASDGRAWVCGSGPSRICALPDAPIWARCSWTARRSARTTRRRAQGGRLSHALGRSLGGYGTKAVLARDARGLALAFVLLCGQASELRGAPALLAAVTGIGPTARVVCNRAYSSRRWRRMIEEAGAEPCVPANRTHPHASYDRSAYRRRHPIENAWTRLKESRAIATRHDKNAASYLENYTSQPHSIGCLTGLREGRLPCDPSGEGMRYLGAGQG